MVTQLTKPPVFDFEAMTQDINSLAMDVLWKGIRKETKLKGLKSGANRGRKSLYGSWAVYKQGKHQFRITSTVPQASRLETGYRTIAYQVLRNGQYIGWRTSEDRKNSVNKPLTRWMELKIPNATSLSPKRKMARSMPINFPLHSIGAPLGGIGILLDGMHPKVQRNLNDRVRQHLKANPHKYIKNGTQ